MDIFRYRDNLIEDYQNYVESFLEIRDERVRRYVFDELNNGALWTNPLIQLNPNFQPGAWVDELVKEGVLHETCARVFRKAKSCEHREAQGQPFLLHRHQEDAI